jgi:hypothetical protein
LIWRSGGEVAETAIHPASYAFVTVLRAGGTLADAAAAGAAQDAGFDAGECLGGLLDRGLIVDFTPEARYPRYVRSTVAFPSTIAWRVTRRRSNRSHSCCFDGGSRWRSGRPAS